jgi:CHASE2 domain-containing sensor protein
MKAKKRHLQSKPKVLGIYWALGLSVLIFILSFSPILETFERKIFDQATRIRGERKINPVIQIVEIDDKSIENFGRWPWPRGYHASFLQILSEYKPKTIGYDILFSEPELEHPEEDIALAKKTKDIASVIYPFFFVISEDQMFQSGKLKKLPQEIQDRYSLDYKIKPKDKFLKSMDIYLPMSLLIKSSFGIGHVNVPADTDGFVRRVPLVIEFKDRLYPSFDLLVVCNYLDIRIKNIRIMPHYIGLVKNSKFIIKIPIDEKGRMLVNFAGRYEALPKKSFSQVILAYDQIKNSESSIINLEEFNRKIVLVGLSATGTADIRSTAFSEKFPGIGIHANVINNILNRDFVIWINKFILAVIILVLTLLIAVVSPRLNPFKSFLFTFSIILIYVLGSFFLFVIKGIWLRILCPVFAMSATYTAIILNQFIVSRFENQVIKKELTIASQIQQGMLPQVYPKIMDLDFYCYNKPAKFVGGDLYDFFLVDKDSLALAIGDVSGKGVPAALLMAKIITYLRSAIGLHKEPNKVLSYINEKLLSEGSSGMFVTMLYLVVDFKTRSLLFSNAGHHSMVYVNQSEDKFKSLSEDKAMPIGLMPITEFSTHIVKFLSGDIFVLFTDGIIEAVNKEGKEYEMNIFKNLILRNKFSSAKELTDKIIQDVEEFAKGNIQHDDMTIVTLKIK